MSIKFENRKALRAFADTLQKIDNPKFVRDVKEKYEEKVFSLFGEYDVFGITVKDVSEIAKNYLPNLKSR